MNMSPDPNVLIRADVTAKDGLLHVRRCFNLARAFREKGLPRIVWAGTQETLEACPDLKREFTFIPLPDDADQYRQIRALQSRIDIQDDTKTLVVIDGSHLDYKTVNGLANIFRGVTAVIVDEVDRSIGTPDIVFSRFRLKPADYRKNDMIPFLVQVMSGKHLDMDSPQRRFGVVGSQARLPRTTIPAGARRVADIMLNRF